MTREVRHSEELELSDGTKVSIEYYSKDKMPLLQIVYKEGKDFVNLSPRDIEELSAALYTAKYAMGMDESGMEETRKIELDYIEAMMALTAAIKSKCPPEALSG